MALTAKQKRQIRHMIIDNPTIENMERIAALSDSEVINLLTDWKTAFKKRMTERLALQQIEEDRQLALKTAITTTLTELE